VVWSEEQSVLCYIEDKTLVMSSLSTAIKMLGMRLLQAATKIDHNIEVFDVFSRGLIDDIEQILVIKDKWVTKGQMGNKGTVFC